MATIFDAATRDRVIDRFRSLEPDAPRQWGKLTSDKMLCHVADQLRLALGEIEAAPPRGPLRYWPINYLLLHVLPWPKGKAKGPDEAFTTAPTTWEQDRDTLFELIHRVSSKSPDDSWPLHPLFGKMSGRDWGVLSCKHLDHHLRQFSG